MITWLLLLAYLDFDLCWSSFFGRVQYIVFMYSLLSTEIVHNVMIYCTFFGRLQYIVFIYSLLSTETVNNVMIYCTFFSMVQYIVFMYSLLSTEIVHNVMIYCTFFGRVQYIVFMYSLLSNEIVPNVMICSFKDFWNTNTNQIWYDEFNQYVLKDQNSPCKAKICHRINWIKQMQV